MSLQILLTPIPNQRFEVILNQQNCAFTLIQRNGSIYMSLVVNDEPIFYGRKCLSGVFLIFGAYEGFSGQLIWFDTDRENDPEYSGLGSRYRLIYVPPEDLP